MLVVTFPRPLAAPSHLLGSGLLSSGPCGPPAACPEALGCPTPCRVDRGKPAVLWESAEWTAAPAHLLCVGRFLPQTGRVDAAPGPGAAPATNTFQGSGSLKFKQTTTIPEEGRDGLPAFEITREVPPSASPRGPGAGGRGNGRRLGLASDALHGQRPRLARASGSDPPPVATEAALCLLGGRCGAFWASPGVQALARSAPGGSHFSCVSTATHSPADSRVLSITRWATG